MKCPKCNIGELVGDAPNKRVWFNCDHCDNRYFKQGKYYYEALGDRSYGWDKNGEFIEFGKDYGTCENCKQSLKGSTFVLPYEMGNNLYAYVECSHCGYKNIKYGCGEDD